MPSPSSNNNKNNRPSPTKEELQALRDQGLSREQMAERYGVGLSQMKRWIAALGVKPAAKRPSRARPKKQEEPKLEDGFSLVDIAAYRLGDRLTERKGRGYYLDGQPASTATILAAAGLDFLDAKPRH